MKFKDIIFIIIVLALGFTIVHLYNRNQNANKTIEYLTENNSKIEDDTHFYKSNRIHEISLNGIKLPNDAFVLSESNDTLLLKDIINSDKLVLRYSELHCNSCVDIQIKNLQNKADSIGLDNILLFTTAVSNNYIQQFKRMNQVKFKVYKLPADLENEIPDIDIPYYFMLEKDNLRMNCVFVAQKEIPKLTNSYLEQINKKYF